MPRYDRSDILMELIELCRDLKSDILQQLNYYRASVYKSETAQQIEARVAQLHDIADMMGSETIREAFRDYEEMKLHGGQHAMPGECLLSKRLSRLFQSLEAGFDDELLASKQLQDSVQLSRSIQKNRHRLLTACRQGSRQWAFFSAI